MEPQCAAPAPTPTIDAMWDHKVRPGSQGGRIDLTLPFEPGIVVVVHVANCDWSSLVAHYRLGAWRHTFALPHSEFQLRAGLDRSYQIEVPAGTEKTTVTRLAAHAEHFDHVGLAWRETPQLSAIIGDADAAVQCGKRQYGTLVGAFRSTAGEIADWVENVNYPDGPQPRITAWRQMPPSSPGYLCYFDAVMGKGPPPVPGASPAPAFDRSLILLDASGAVVPPAKLGYQRNVPIMPPGGRF